MHQRPSSDTALCSKFTLSRAHDCRSCHLSQLIMCRLLGPIMWKVMTTWSHLCTVSSCASAGPFTTTSVPPSLVRAHFRFRTTSFCDIYATIAIILQVSSLVFLFTYTLWRSVWRCFSLKSWPLFTCISDSPSESIYSFLRCTNNVLAVEIQIFSYSNLSLLM